MYRELGYLVESEPDTRAGRRAKEILAAARRGISR